MITHIVQCEMCEEQYQFLGAALQIPEKWVTVLNGNPTGKDGLHFCSNECLRVWINGKLPPYREGRLV